MTKSGIRRNMKYIGDKIIGGKGESDKNERRRVNEYNVGRSRQVDVIIGGRLKVKIDSIPSNSRC